MNSLINLILFVEKKNVMKNQTSVENKVSLLGVVALWGDCTFIPADWGS